jgi:hypothetical protein
VLCKIIVLLTVLRGTKYEPPARYLPMHSIVDTDVYPDGSTFRFLRDNKTVKKLWIENGQVRDK